MRPLHEGDYLRLLTDPAGGAVLSLLFYEHDRQYGICSVDLDNGVGVRCGALPKTIPVGLAGTPFAAWRAS